VFFANEVLCIVLQMHVKEESNLQICVLKILLLCVSMMKGITGKESRLFSEDSGSISRWIDLRVLPKSFLAESSLVESIPDRQPCITTEKLQPRAKICKQASSLLTFAKPSLESEVSESSLFLSGQLDIVLRSPL
jgi:hypothetical protein